MNELAEVFHLSLWVRIIEFIGALIILSSMVTAIQTLFQTGDPLRARLLVSQGIISALNFTLAAALLKTIGLNTWHQIGMLSVVLILRTFLKRFFIWEHERLRKREEC